MIPNLKKDGHGETTQFGSHLYWLLCIGKKKGDILLERFEIGCGAEANKRHSQPKQLSLVLYGSAGFLSMFSLREIVSLLPFASFHK